jgi:hypothetical protein
MAELSLLNRQERIRRRRALADDWPVGRTPARAEHDLFDACFALAESAQEFEQVAGGHGSAPATAAALGCMASALEAQATAFLKMRSLAAYEASHADGKTAAGEAEELGRLLYAISQNLRFGAQLSELARRAITP